MKKSDLIQEIADKTGIPKVDVIVTLETFFKEIKKSLAVGENVYIRGFGSFVTKKRAAKTGRDIQKNIAVPIPAHYFPGFRPAQELIDGVRSRKIEEDDVNSY